MPHTRHRLAAIAAAFAAAALASPAGAAIVTYQFSGVVTHSIVDGVSVNDRIDGFYTFDTAAADTFENTPSTPIGDGSGPKVGIYPQVTEAGFRIRDFVYLTRFPVDADHISGGIYVTNDIGGWDMYSVSPLGFSITLADATAQVFNSDDLPLGPPDPARFSNTQFYFGNNANIMGVIQSIVVGPPNVSAVPVAPTLALVLAGLAAAAVVQRRRGR